MKKTLDLMYENKKASVLLLVLFPMFIMLSFFDWFLYQLQVIARGLLNSYDDWMVSTVRKFIDKKESLR